MAEEHLNIQWRNENGPTYYPFVNGVSLTNAEGYFIPSGVFIDMRMYIPGADADQYLSTVAYTGTTATIWFGDSQTAKLASIEFEPLGLPDGLLRLELTDLMGRPCGVILTDKQRLSFVQAWPVGEQTFERAQTALIPVVLTPMPATGVRSIGVEDLTPLTGDVFLVGRYGVQLIPEPETNSVYVHCPGEPLFQIDLCRDQVVGKPPPMYLKTLTVKWVLNGVPQEVKVYPDAYGNFMISLCGYDELSQELASVLRIYPQGNGLKLEAVK